MEQEQKNETAPCCTQEEYHEDRVAAVNEDLPADGEPRKIAFRNRPRRISAGILRAHRSSGCGASVYDNQECFLVSGAAPHA